MNKKLRALLCLALLAVVSQGFSAATTDYPEGYPQTDRTKECINSKWRFHLGDADSKFFTTSTNDSAWEEVSIPHTLELTSISLNDCPDDKYQTIFQREVGWYRRDIFVDRSDKLVSLQFEGAHQITTLWVNGKEVGVHKTGGYTPFNFNITPYVKRGAKNQVTVMVDNRRSMVTPPDPGPFDYIKFSGLYRDVYLVETNQMHITSNLESMNSGITITTPSVDYVNGNATIDIRTEIRNSSRKSQSATLIQRVVDAEGNVVLKLEESAVIAAGATHRFYQIGGVEDNVKFWSTDYPYLYKVNSTLYNEDGEAIDVVDNRLGLRKVEYDHETGFKINGKNIELIGFNRHQHYGYIGDAMPNSLHYKDMIQFKEWGFNCMRTAHYPQDDEVLRACDELGILVYEEAPTWISMSTEPEWYENERAATQAMIRNHKNSPSVIIWGGGINHRGAVAESHFVVKQEDPTRLTGSQSSRWTGWQNSSWTDIFGNMNYGPGIWDRSEPLFAMEGGYGPEAIAPYKRDPMMPGMISWTAHAYYTFHDIGNVIDRTRSGAMDSFRYPKNDRLYWYPAEMKTKPYIHVVDTWTADLQMLTIYSNATELELILNGESMGRFRPSTAFKYDGLDHAPYEIAIDNYEDGELEVIGYREGEVIANTSVFTPSEPAKLNLVVDKYDIDFVADGNDILAVHAEVLDKNGMRIRDFEGEISFNVAGEATIVGDGANINANPVMVQRGVGSALIRATYTPGNVKITASCKGLKSASASVETVETSTDMMLNNAYAIKDYETMVVDLGAPGQLVQFGWTPWIVEDKEDSATISIAPAKLTNYVAGDTPAASSRAMEVEAGSDNAYTFSIHTNSGDGVMRWLGEMNVIGQNGFVYGDGVLAIDKKGVTLEIEDLPKGNYVLRTYHHAPSSNTNDMDPNLERLKSESLHKLPYAKAISVSVDGDLQVEHKRVTSGKELQYSKVAISEVEFESKGSSIEIEYNSEDDNPGVWINGFELVRKL